MTNEHELTQAEQDAIEEEEHAYYIYCTEHGIDYDETSDSSEESKDRELCPESGQPMYPVTYHYPTSTNPHGWMEKRCNDAGCRCDQTY